MLLYYLRVVVFSYPPYPPVSNEKRGYVDMVIVPARFPSLRKIEISILKRFLPQIPDNYKLTINFRFPIPTQEIPKGLSPPEKKMWIAIHQKRVEAVAEGPAQTWIIEVKERVVPSALGELLMYKKLYKTFINSSKNLRLFLVAGRDDPLMRPVLREHNIEVVIV